MIVAITARAIIPNGIPRAIPKLLIPECDFPLTEGPPVGGSPIRIVKSVRCEHEHTTVVAVRRVSLQPLDKKESVVGS